MATTTKKKSKLGRPRKRKADKFRTPARQIGRIDSETWARVREAYESAAGDESLTFTKWAVGRLLRRNRQSLGRKFIEVQPENVVRQVGRVDDETWEEIRDNYDSAYDRFRDWFNDKHDRDPGRYEDYSFTRWALDKLLT